MIEARLHDGTVLQFPDGTDPAVIKAAVQRVLASRQPAAPMGSVGASAEPHRGDPSSPLLPWNDPARRGVGPSTQAINDIAGLAPQQSAGSTIAASLRGILPSAAEGMAQGMEFGASAAKGLLEARAGLAFSPLQPAIPVPQAYTDARQSVRGMFDESQEEILGANPGNPMVGAMAAGASNLAGEMLPDLAAGGAAALTGRVASKAASPLARLVTGKIDGAIRLLAGEMTSRGHLPQAAFDRANKAGGAIQARIYEAQGLTRELERGINEWTPAAAMEASATAPAVSAVSQSPVASPQRPWEMTPDDLDRAIDQASASDKDLLARLFGAEGAKAYSRAQGVANSSYLPRDQQDSAWALVEKMESSLSEAQRNELFGVNAGDDFVDVDELREYRRAIGGLDWDSPQALGESLRYALVKVGRERDPAKMNHTQRVAYAQMRRAYEGATEEGWDLAVVSQSAARAAASRFADPADAELLLGHFRRSEPPSGAGRLGATLEEARSVTQRLESQVDQHLALRPLESRGALLERLDAALKGSDVLIPQGFRPVVTKMRSVIDSLTDEVIASDLVDDGLKEVLQENLGQYLNRSYRVFDEADYAKKVRNTPVWGRAKAHFQERLADENWTDPEIEGLMEHLVTKYGEDTFSALAGRVGKKDLTIFKARKEIPEPIRDLLGEYKDPSVNFMRSVTKMSNDIERHAMLKDIREAGMDKFLFERALPGHAAKIKGGSTRDPLAGLYSSPEITKALEDAFTAQERTLYGVINGAVKAGKTVGSIQTHARNLGSNGPLLLRHGIAPLTVGPIPSNLTADARTAWRAGTSELFDAADDARTLYSDALRHGVVGQSADAGDALSFIEGLRGGVVAKATRSVARAYNAEDSVPKLYLWLTERKRSLALGMNEEQAKGYGAWIVRNTMPTYDMVPRGVKHLRDTPLVGTFVSFPAEMVRTTKNMGKLILHELGIAKMPDLPWSAGMRANGAKRLAGTLAAFGLPAGAAMATRAYLGLDSDQTDAMREFMAPWDENSEFTVTSAGKGKYTVVSASFADPHSSLKKPFVAAMRDGDFGDTFEQVATEALGPYLGEEMLAGTLIDVWRNQKAKGGNVYHEGDTPGRKVAAAAERLYRGMAPGTLLSGERIARAAAGTSAGKAIGADKFLAPGTRYGQQYELGNEITALLGPRSVTIDVADSLKWHGYKFQRLRADARRIYNEEANRSVGFNPERVREARQSAESAWQETQELILRKVKAAQALGLSDKDIYDVLAPYMNNDDIDLWLSGQEAPLRLDE